MQNAIVSTPPHSLETITPARAAEFLKNRGDNIDRLPPAQEDATIDLWAGIIGRGKWSTKTTAASPFILGENNVLLNGAHRCGGIVKANRTVDAWVLRDPSLSSVHDIAVDSQMRLRNDAFVLREDRGLVAVAKLALTVHGNRGLVAGLDQISVIADALRLQWHELGFDSIPKSKRSIVRATPFQLAACVHLRNGSASKEYLLSIIDSVLREEHNKLPPYFLSFYFQYTKTKKHQRALASPRMYRAIAERLGDLVLFKSAHDNSEFVSGLRRAYGSALPTLSLPQVPVAHARRKLWSDEQVVLLHTGCRENWSVRKIAIATRRTAAAVRSKASELGLSLDR